MYYIEEFCTVNKGIAPNNNEDNIFVNGFNLVQNNNGISNYKKEKRVSNKLLCYGVFDGLGGLSNGEYASYVAVTILSKLYNKHSIKRVLLKINNALLKIKKEEHIDMGTTASIIKIKKNKAILSLVGDSSIFILSDGKFSKYNEEDNQDNLLDNYLGKDNNLKIKQHKVTLKNNDKIIICSDGLTKSVGELEIEYILDSSNDVSYITNKLLNESLINGGKDNISIITLLVKKDYKDYIYIAIFVLIVLIVILLVCI